MTRFLMSVESVDLVFHAFKNAKPGDIFVQKSPASTIGDLADAIIDLIKPNHAKQIIGTRHGESIETLVSREELLRSDDMEKFTEFSLTLVISITISIFQMVQLN